MIWHDINVFLVANLGIVLYLKQNPRPYLLSIVIYIVLK